MDYKRSNIELLFQNGKRVFDGEGRVDLLEDHATLEACLGLPGGKGGFGSMLRALGAQIEKTTNRCVCTKVKLSFHNLAVARSMLTTNFLKNLAGLLSIIMHE